MKCNTQAIQACMVEPTRTHRTLGKGYENKRITVAKPGALVPSVVCSALIPIRPGRDQRPVVCKRSVGRRGINIAHQVRVFSGARDDADHSCVIVLC